MERAGVTCKPEWIINGSYHPSSGYEMFAQLCAQLGRPPKALFTAACGLLEGVLRYLTQHQLMESDIHLCSFDDHYLFDCMTLKIDTVAQDCRALAQHSFDQLPRSSMSGRWNRMRFICRAASTGAMPVPGRCWPGSDISESIKKGA